MKIADVTVGTEYAYVNYQQRGETEYRMVERAQRVVVRSIAKGGKVRLSRWDRDNKTFFNSTNEDRAVNLVMPWAQAVPLRAQIREDRIKSAQHAKAQQDREQVALRALGEFLENHDAIGMPGLPYDLKNSVALANGDDGVTESRLYPHRHNPTLNLNVITLVALLRKAYGDGKFDWNREAAPWSQEVS